MAGTIRILIYARGTLEEIAEQQGQCQRIAEEFGDRIVSLASDPPGGCSGWASARNMLAAGLIDRILVTSRNVTPLAPYVDSVSREFRSPYKRDPQHAAESALQRRPQRLRRR